MIEKKCYYFGQPCRLHSQGEYNINFKEDSDINCAYIIIIYVFFESPVI